MNDLLAREHKAQLEHVAEKSRNENHARRARLLLLLDSGKSVAEVSNIVGLAPSTVIRWRRGYIKQQLGIFPDNLIATNGQLSNGQAKLKKLVPTPGQEAASNTSATETTVKKPAMMDKKKAKAQAAKSAKRIKKAMANSKALLKRASKSKTAKKIKKTKAFKTASRKLENELKTAKKVYRDFSRSKKVKRLKKQTARLENRVKSLKSHLK